MSNMRQYKTNNDFCSILAFTLNVGVFVGGKGGGGGSGHNFLEMSRGIRA